MSYPDAAEGADGFIHVVNDHERTKARQIMHHVFAAFETLLGRIDNPSAPAREIYLPAPLVIRESAKRKE